MTLDKFVYMANQISKFFVSQGQEQAVAGTANHIIKFWDPRMRQAIVAHLKAGGAGLDPVARLAVETLPEVKSEAVKSEVHKSEVHGEVTRT